VDLSKFAYGYTAVMAGGLTFVTTHSVLAALLVGVAAWTLAHLMPVAPGLFAREHSHTAAEDFRRRWHSL
jgi:hypothetical protein